MLGLAGAPGDSQGTTGGAYKLTRPGGPAHAQPVEASAQPTPAPPFSPLAFHGRSSTTPSAPPKFHRSHQLLGARGPDPPPPPAGPFPPICPALTYKVLHAGWSTASPSAPLVPSVGVNPPPSAIPTTARRAVIPRSFLLPPGPMSLALSRDSIQARQCSPISLQRSRHHRLHP